MTKMTVAQFVKEYEGQTWDFDGAYGVQCVDLFNYYNQEVVGAPRIGTPVTNGARDLFEVDSAARRAYYDVVSPSADLIVGDVLVYGEPHGRAVINGKQIFYGHVAIFIGDNNVIESNARKGIYTSVDPVFKNGLLGILRPREFAVNSVPQNVPDQTQNKNKHIIASGDTFWGLEDVYNWEHGTLQNLNPTINPRSLAIGSEIIIPGQEQTVQQPDTTYYTIVGGDTFWDLENAWNLEHGELEILNPGQDPRTLQIGQRIRRS
jgi:LysM repeat protein